MVPYLHGFLGGMNEHPFCVLPDGWYALITNVADSWY